ncbi:Thiol:disulfide interchange protein DsbA [Candidatus Hartigia pinicola]|nr:Thiol:disulfide interchange protein DsbA [Candidatus Hartigia pinicola]
MKKIILAIIGITMSFLASSGNYLEGKEYAKIQPSEKSLPQVLEFFSFYCSQCYQFENIYKIPKTVEKNLPEGIKVERYHIDSLGPLGPYLTQAWAVAIALKIEQKILPILLEKIQKTQLINTPEDIRNTFMTLGISGEEYDAALNSFIVKSLVVKQKNAAKKLKLRAVPTVFVNGKYQICNNSIEVKHDTDYGKEFSNIVNYLINKK